ncbi:MAG: GMC family oxidoreductase [Flavobacteriaceae bacterium]
MHTDARTLEHNSLIEGDICIVGAGAAGISMALEWIGGPHKIILLEGGGFEFDEKIQALNDGPSTGQKYYPLQSSRLRYFGGTTGHWAGLCTPFDPIDFAQRDYVPESGWPIGKQDLDPFYVKAQQTLGLGPYQYDLAYWQASYPDFIPFPLDRNIIWNKMWQYSKARFGPLYKETLLEAKNVHLYTYANVVDLKATNNITAIKEVTIKDHSGKQHKVRAKYFVLACGTIQNTRLLLASNSQASSGLGNEHDLVGRYFMEHLEIASAELWMLKPFKTDLYVRDYRVTQPSAELAITEKEQRLQKILNGTASLIPLALGRNQKPKMETWQDTDPRKAKEITFSQGGEAIKKSAHVKEGPMAQAYQLNTRIEQAPNPDSRITLGSERDALGVPKASLHWQLTALDKSSIRKIHELIGQQFGISGLGRVRFMEFLRDADDLSWPVGTNGGWHHMGTTRMSEDPKKGVVDANCKVHGISNLYIAGAACFPTAGAANPTLTLMALSLRLSEHLKKRFS